MYICGHLREGGRGGKTPLSINEPPAHVAFAGVKAQGCCRRARHATQPQEPARSAPPAHRAVPAHHHPGGEAAVDAAQVRLDPRPLLAAALEEVLCRGARSKELQVARSCVHIQAASGCRHRIPSPLRVSARAARQHRAKCNHSAAYAGAPVEYWMKWIGPKSKENQGLSSATVGMRVRR